MKTSVLSHIKILVQLFICSIILSCSSIKKEEYNVINKLLEDDEVYKMLYNVSKKSDATILFDTILVSNKVYKNIENIHFDLNWENLYAPKERYVYSVFWKDLDKRIVLSDGDKMFIKNQLKNDTIVFKIEQKNITIKNCVVVNDYYPNNVDKFQYNYFNTKKRMPIYVVSKPIFNKKKNISLISLMIYSNESYVYNLNVKNKLLIFKKVNKNWKYYGYESDVVSQN